MGKINKKLLLAIFFFFFVITIGGFLMIRSHLTSEQGDLVITENHIDVLKEPYPLNYPSTKPRPNTVIAVLKKGERVKVINYRYGKDYMVYKIKLQDGRNGYVIYKKDAFRVETPVNH